ncbi:MAG: glycosyltransferase family 4 protein [Promethearchaeota archaeon]
MKIAYLTHYFPPAGYAASVNTYEIVKRLAARGHQVLVLSQPVYSDGTTQPSSQHERSQHANLNVYSSFTTPLPLSFFVPHAMNLLKAMKLEYDIVITQFHVFHLASLPGYVIRTLRNKPWIVKVHDLNPDPSLFRSVQEKMLSHLCYEGLLNILGKKADKILIQTKELKHILERSHHSPDRIVIFPHGVDTNLFSPSTKATPSANRTILYIGAMRPQYGLDRLIKAFALLTPKGNLRLTLVGDGPERTRLAELARKLGVEEKVDFRGYIAHDRLPEVIRNAYIAVGPLLPTPANYYTISTKVLEYFACGKTVVSTRLSRDILVHGHTGLVVKAPLPKVIAEVLSNLIGDETLTTRLANNARRLAAEKFDWEKIIDKLEKELEDVISSGFH